MEDHAVVHTRSLTRTSSPTCTDACTHTRAHGSLHTVTLHSQTSIHPTFTHKRPQARGDIADAHPAVSPARQTPPGTSNSREPIVTER